MEFNLQIHVGKEVLETVGRLQDEQFSVREFLPLLRTLTDEIMASLTRQSEAGGRQISCKSGCGACCRQVVPVSREEVIALFDLVNKLPDGQRDVITNRFADSIKRLEESGIMDNVSTLSQLTSREDLRVIGMEYFKLDIPCPFLENQSCSIHPYRPLSCREYLVTSPSVCCQDPGPEKIKLVEVPRKLSNLLYRLSDINGEHPGRWLPLILSLDKGPELLHCQEPHFSGMQFIEIIAEYFR
jgi:Fe-S-cluster containining protein